MIAYLQILSQPWLASCKHPAPIDTMVLATQLPTLSSSESEWSALIQKNNGGFRKWGYPIEKIHFRLGLLLGILHLWKPKRLAATLALENLTVLHPFHWCKYIYIYISYKSTYVILYEHLVCLRDHMTILPGSAAGAAALRLTCTPKNHSKPMGLVQRRSQGIWRNICYLISLYYTNWLVDRFPYEMSKSPRTWVDRLVVKLYISLPFNDCGVSGDPGVEKTSATAILPPVVPLLAVQLEDMHPAEANPLFSYPGEANKNLEAPWDDDSQVEG